MAGQPKKKGAKKKEKRIVPAGVAHIQASFNNTTVTIADHGGQRRVLVQRRLPRLQGLAEGNTFRSSASCDYGREPRS